MNPKPAAGTAKPFATLRRLAQPRITREQCELCNTTLETEHRHLLEMSSRKILCACDACALRFEPVMGGRFKLIPRHGYSLPHFRLTDEQWENFALPINLAFFFHHTPAGKMLAMYPSPAGATESLLTFSVWEALVADNPALNQMEPDVQALLVNRVGTARQYYLAPMDACYELVGLIRVHWRGLSGGEEVWEHIAAFFARLKERSEPLPAVAAREVSHV